MYKLYRCCYQGNTWQGEICGYKGDSHGDRESETLLRFAHRKKVNIKLQKLLEISFSSLSLMFPHIVWLPLFILWSVK